MFVTYKKYKKIKDDYNILFECCEKQKIKQNEFVKAILDENLTAIKEICFLRSELEKYKNMYADELQKRLDFAETIRMYDKNKGG